MSNRILFYGASDDLVEFEGYINEEFNLPADGWKGYLLSPDGQRVELTADYIREWELGVKVLTGNVVDWKVQLTGREDVDDFDPGIAIYVPDGTELVVLDPTEG